MMIYCSNQFCNQVISASQEPNEFGIYAVCNFCGIPMNSLKGVEYFEHDFPEIVKLEVVKTAKEPVKLFIKKSKSKIVRVKVKPKKVIRQFFEKLFKIKQ